MMLCFMVIIEEKPCLTEISILKRYNNFKFVLRFHMNSSPNPHQNLEKSQLQDMNLE